MRASFDDIHFLIRFYADRMGMDSTPLWWDENGVPRFRAHHPNLSPNIYANEVALVLISCQECRREFRVQMVSGKMDAIWQRVSAFGPAGKVADAALAIARQLSAPLGGKDDSEHGAKLRELAEELNALRDKPPATLADAIRAGTIHYGDPPRHDDTTGPECHAGDTMNCYDLRVLEYWTNDPVEPDVVATSEWRRIAELEGPLPDANTDA